MVNISYAFMVMVLIALLFILIFNKKRLHGLFILAVFTGVLSILRYMMPLNPVFDSTIDYLIKDPVLITSTIAIIIGLLYYFGRIVNANTWQYQNVKGHIHLQRGFIFVTRRVFIPILISFAILSILEFIFTWQNILITSVPNFLLPGEHVSLEFYFLIIAVVLIGLDKLDKWAYEKSANFEEIGWFMKCLVLISFPFSILLKFLFFLSNYAIFSSSSKIALFILIWLDFIILSRWAGVVNLYYQDMDAKVYTLDDNDPIHCTAIEFIQNDNFLKVHEMNIPGESTEKVFVLLTSRIKKIEIGRKQHNASFFVIEELLKEYII